MAESHTRPTIHRMVVDESSSLARLTALMEISIGQAHTILHSIEDITQLPGPPDAGLRNRDSGYSDARGSIDGSDLSRRLLTAERKVEENRAYLRDLKRANLHGLQIMFEDPDGEHRPAIECCFHLADLRFSSCHHGASKHHQNQLRGFE